MERANLNHSHPRPYLRDDRGDQGGAYEIGNEDKRLKP
jgi:hypothetical protein